MNCLGVFINFTHSCLSSDSDSVRFVAYHGVYFRRMLSPIGRNAQYFLLFALLCEFSQFYFDK